MTDWDRPDTPRDIAAEDVLPFASRGSKGAPAVRGVLYGLIFLLFTHTLLLGLLFYTEISYRQRDETLREAVAGVRQRLEASPLAHEPEAEAAISSLREVSATIEWTTLSEETVIILAMAALILEGAAFSIVMYLLAIRLPRKYPELWEQR